jgi:hypothetical protein
MYEAMTDGVCKLLAQLQYLEAVFNATRLLWWISPDKTYASGRLTADRCLLLRP